MLPMLLFAISLVAQSSTEKAATIKEGMWSTSQLVVEKMGRGVSLWRPYGIQMKLLKEDLEWQKPSYYKDRPREILIIQTVVLGEALKRAAEAAEYPTEEQRNHLTHILLYQKAGLALLEHYLEELGEVEDEELRFRL